MSDVRRTRGQQGPHDETRTEMARQAARDLHRISSDDREQQLGENGEEQGASIQDKPKKNSAKGVVIAIIVIALLQIVPAIFAFVMDDLVPEIESSFGNAPAPEYDSDYSDDYDTDYDSDYAYDTLYDVFGDNGITVSAFDNVYTFQASGDGSSYEFSYTENGNRTFRSTARPSVTARTMRTIIIGMSTRTTSTLCTAFTCIRSIRRPTVRSRTGAIL